MDTGASNEGQQGCSLPLPQPGHRPWNNSKSPVEAQEKSSECQLPLYYNTPSEGSHPSNAPSPFPSSHGSPATTMPYATEQDRYQPHSHFVGTGRPDHSAPGSFPVSTSWSVQPSAPASMALDRMRQNGRPPSRGPNPYYPATPGKGPVPAWHRPPYSSPYPPYGSEAHRRKQFSRSDIAGPVTPAFQSNSNGNFVQHQHTPILVPNPHYNQNNVPQTMDGRAPELQSPDSQKHMMANERNMYSPMQNQQNASFYMSQQHAQRQTSMPQFPPVGLPPPGVPPYPVNSAPAATGKGKSRSNKSYQCPKCVKVFRRGDHLKRHLLSVHDHEHPYQCGDCGKGFASIAALLKHAKSLHVSNMTKGLMCLRCNMTFVSMQEIETHANTLHVREDETYMQNINTSSKQHSCIQCAKTFTSAVNLKRHLQLVHRSKDDSKTFCRECGKSFARIEALRKHVDKTHNGNPNALPPDDLEEGDNARQASFSENESRGPSADTDESSLSSNTQWPIAPPAPDQAKPNVIARNPNVPPPNPYQPGGQPQINSDPRYRQTPGPDEVEKRPPSIPQTQTTMHSIAPNDGKFNRHPYTNALQQDSRTPNAAVDVKNTDVFVDTVAAGNATEPQSVSEAFSMAMRTLSEYDYESSDLDRFTEFLDPAAAHRPYQFVHGDLSFSAGLEPETHGVNGDRYVASVRTQRNFLVTMPLPPDATTAGCLPTTGEPRRPLPQQQGGGGGVEVPNVDAYDGRISGRAKVNDAPSRFRNLGPGKNKAAPGQADAGQGSVDLSCNVCETEYEIIDDLMSHIEVVHLKVNPEECCICKKRFSQAGNVKRHIRFVHLRERPFRCMDCSCTFDRLCYLQRHMRTHLQWNEENQEFNPLKPCCCPECGKRCLTAHHLRGHMQRKHFAKNKRNYAQFLAKYGHLEALGNGPGALASQRGKRGRKKKKADAGDAPCIRGKAKEQPPHSSPMPLSSSESQPLSNYGNYQHSNLQIKAPVYDLPRDNFASDDHQSPQQVYAPHPEYHNTPPASRPNTRSPGVISFAVEPAVRSHQNVSNYDVSSQYIWQSTVSTGDAVGSSEKVLRPPETSGHLKSKEILLPFRCQRCVFKRFRTLAMLRSHMSLYHGRSLIKHMCRLCGASFANKGALTAHRAKKHRDCGVGGAKRHTDCKASASANFSANGTSDLSQKQYQHGRVAPAFYGSSENSMNFFSYDPNSPGMVPSPNLDALYVNSKHNITTSRPLILT